MNDCLRKTLLLIVLVSLIAQVPLLAEAVAPRSKVLLTCRTAYFKHRGEEEEILEPQRGEVRVVDREEIIDLMGREQYEVVHLMEFDDDDIQAALEKRLPAQWQPVYDRIRTLENLRDLASRPVLLDMIAKTLPRIKDPSALNQATLYENYIDELLRRRYEPRVAPIPPEERMFFLEELAWEMFSQQKTTVHFSEFPQRVKEHFKLDDVEKELFFERDIRTQSYLVRDDIGNYRFGHKSFLEFLVAKRLFPPMLKHQAGEVAINEEVRGFIHDMFQGVEVPQPQVEAPQGMVHVPPGDFILGGEHGEWGLLIRIAHLEEGFFIGKYPVTNRQYKEFVDATGHTPPLHWEEDRCPEGIGNHPVVYVTWYDARDYCNWLREKTHRPCRLPTEAEWERATRGVDGRLYPWGDKFDADRCNTYESGIDNTTAVSRYSPEGDSPCAACDMAGNVWEWSSSVYKPAPWEDKVEPLYVMRGGSFANSRQSARCDFQLPANPDRRLDNFGFRVVDSPGSPI